MADWSHPVLSDSYSSILTTHLVGRDVDALTLCNVDPTNIPEHAIKYNRSSNKFQERVSGSWVDLDLSIAGGGTGANTASGARANLGLGTMATQNSSGVAITGGSISGIAISAGDISSGTLALARGGTGASLSLGTAGKALISNGSAVVFGLAGVVFQVKRFSTTAQTALANGSYSTIAALQASITPVASTNRIRIETSVNIGVSAAVDGLQGAWFDIKITRGTNVSDPTVAEFLAVFASTQIGATTVYLDCIDSPGTTSAITYQAHGRGHATGQGAVNHANWSAATISSMTVSEIV